MERIVEQNLLYDFYGELLTEHQKLIYEKAVYEDLSLKELSDEYGITRQGIHDLIRRCDRILGEYENKLHMIERFEKIRELVGGIDSLAKSMGTDGAVEISSLCEQIMENL
ncbi:MAG: DNA-binding protein [Lachnospiraceae bacterium]|nr:DNA-binding protein [Lachnospiraceae bacterium]